MPERSIKIRSAQEADYSVVNALYRELYTPHREALPGIFQVIPEKVISRGTYLSLLEDEQELLLVAEHEGAVIGYLNACIETSDGDLIYQPYRRVSVDDISVAASSRGQGVEEALLAAATEWATEQHATSITTIVYAFNQSTQDFFQKAAFVPVSIRYSRPVLDEGVNSGA